MQAVLNLVNNIEVKIFSNKSCSNSDHVFSAKFKSPNLYSINNLHILKSLDSSTDILSSSKL